MHQLRNAGFTLIELMIAVAIIGILAAIAYPSYQDYVIRGKIPEATNTLSSARVKLEQYYQDNRSYGTTSATVCTSGTPASTPNFDYACGWGATSSNQSFLVTATGKGSLSWLKFTINQASERTSVVTSGPSGWSSNGACWITKKGGLC